MDVVSDVFHEMYLAIFFMVHTYKVSVIPFFLGQVPSREVLTKNIAHTSATTLALQQHIKSITAYISAKSGLVAGEAKKEA